MHSLQPPSKLSCLIQIQEFLQQVRLLYQKIAGVLWRPCFYMVLFLVDSVCCWASCCCRRLSWEGERRKGRGERRSLHSHFVSAVRQPCHSWSVDQIHPINRKWIMSPPAWTWWHIYDAIYRGNTSTKYTYTVSLYSCQPRTRRSLSQKSILHQHATLTEPSFPRSSIGVGSFGGAETLGGANCHDGPVQRAAPRLRAKQNDVNRLDAHKLTTTARAWRKTMNFHKTS